MMDRLEKLVGAWESETIADGQVVARGLTVYGWLEGGKFLVQHADGELTEAAPAIWRDNWPLPSTSIIGLDDAAGGFSMLYADARNVFRIYQMVVEKDVIMLWREAPGFHQRFTGAFDSDANTMTAMWERSPDGVEWSKDFDMVYRRLVQ
ncbi:MAG TPA: hypothetical protein VFC19_22910 [Candidatus Limnocylindrales bacterium]|nr:hypothetical protein [Candidatus Limnocylindrales bacterium]